MLLNSQKISHSLIMAMILMVSLLASQPIENAYAAPPPQLFGEVNLHADLTYDQPSPVARYRYLSVNLDLLLDEHGRPIGRDALPEIALNIFPDLDYIGVVDQVVINGEGNYSWFGHLKGLSNSYYYLVIVGDAFTAHIASTEGIYEVSWAGENLYCSVQIDQSKLIDHPANITYAPPGKVLSPGELGPRADSGATIDVMVLYTRNARIGAGGTDQMKAAIQTALDETKTSYINSDITPRLRLVHAEEVNYSETGFVQTDLDCLADFYGECLGTNKLEAIYSPDLIALIVETGDWCGWARAILADVFSRYMVTKRPLCLTGYYSFGHEFGHLQGARHDLYVDSDSVPYMEGHGYVHLHSSDPAKRWRTVMAYNDECDSHGYDCTRLQWWSNPTKTWLGDVMGQDGNSENYYVLNETAYTIANIAQARISSNFNSNFNTISSGWSSVYGTWKLSDSAYYRTGGVAGSNVSARHTGVFGDMTYTVKMKRTGCTTCSNRIIVRGNADSLNSQKRWKASYEFAYANNGKFGVFELDGVGNVKTIKNWTISTAIVKGDWNILKVVAVDHRFNFYINNTRVWSGTLSDWPIGHVGIGMSRDTTSTGNLLYIDYAKLTNDPLAVVADMLPDAGLEVQVGDGNQSP
jgi:hypothetical protein